MCTTLLVVKSLVCNSKGTFFITDEAVESDVAVVNKRGQRQSPNLSSSFISGVFRTISPVIASCTFHVCCWLGFTLSTMISSSRMPLIDFAPLGCKLTLCQPLIASLDC